MRFTCEVDYFLWPEEVLFVAVMILTITMTQIGNDKEALSGFRKISS